MKTIATLAACACLAAALASPTAFAREETNYPERPVTIIVPYSPGSGMDILARTLGTELTNRLGEPFIVENKPGVAGNLGTRSVVRANGDGYTLLMQINSLVINPHLYSDLDWSLEDLAPVALAARGTPVALTAAPAVPANSVRELIDLGKAQPGRLNYGSPGMGTPQHLAMELFMQRTGTELLHIPFKSTQDILSQMLGGEIHATFLPVHVAVPLARDKRLKILAVDGNQRWHDTPEVPTFAEAGVGGMNVSPWYGILAPANTPASIIERLNGEITAALDSPALAASLLQKGLRVQTSSAAAFGKLMRDDNTAWQRVIQDANITLP